LAGSWRKGTSWDKATLNSEEIKAVATAINELRLSEGISQSVSQYKFVKLNFFKISYQLRGRVFS